jgi:hypothetical protein
MNTKIFAAGPCGQALVVERVADGQSHVLEHDLVVGRAMPGVGPMDACS